MRTDGRSSVDQTANAIISTVSIFSKRVVLHRATHVGEWLSLVEHLVRDQGVGGSNPLSPTIYFLSVPET